MPTLENLRKSAKRWLKAVRAGDAGARDRLRRAYPAAPDVDRVTLRDVQHALARERGYESWVAMTRAAAGGPQAEPLAVLLAAASRGDAETVARILDERPGLIDERGTLAGHTGLRAALHFGVHHEPVVRLLLERGANPNIRDEGDHAYPIHFAAERGELGIVRLLVEHGADPNGEGTSHLLDVVGWAVCFEYANHVDVARYLLAHGAQYTLWTAVALGEAAAIRELASAGADLDARMDRTNHRRTPLHLAVIKKQPAALAALIELGADLNLTDAVGLTPLDQAALDDEHELTRMLLDAGASISLTAAIVLDRPDDVERFLRADPTMMSTTDNRRWARIMVRAASRASGPVLERLLRTVMRHQAGLSIVNLQDDEETAVDGAPGYTPLHAAAWAGNDDAVVVLLQHGANARARDRKYCATPAGWAAYAHHPGTANLILEAGVDIFDAIAFDRADLVRRIVERDPGARDRPFKAYASCEPKEGQWWPEPDCTPLEWAMAQGREQARQALIEIGAGAQTPGDRERTERVVAFLQSACWDGDVHGKGNHRMHDRAAQRLLAEDPSIARESLYTAVVCGDLGEVERRLTEQPEAAREPGGARGWTPILYLAYTRFTHGPTIENALAIARLLLDHGANPNDFYMAGDAEYSALTGVAGEGEQDAPRQPYAAALFDLLLEHGARPFDLQVLYNTHFSADMLWWLELVYAHTVDGDQASAWRDPEWKMFDMGVYGTGARFFLWAAITRHRPRLAEWVLAHGANPNAAPARDQRFVQCSLYALAVIEGEPEIAERLAEHGAVRSTPARDEREQFLDACLRLDRDEARRLLALHPEYVDDPAPMFEAAKRDRPDVLALLLDLGCLLDAQDRTGKRALHEAAIAGSTRALTLLLDRGAEADARESTYGATPIGWASHGDHLQAVDVLAPHSRDICVLCGRGCVDRVRALLAENPSLARAASDRDHAPILWLPDDEERAMQIVELLLAAGADPTVKDGAGRTPADRARRMGMLALAARLALPVSAG